MSAKELIEQVAEGESPRKVITKEAYTPADKKSVKKTYDAYVKSLDKELQDFIDNGLAAMDELDDDKLMSQSEKATDLIEKGINMLSAISRKL